MSTKIDIELSAGELARLIDALELLLAKLKEAAKGKHKLTSV